MSDKPVENKTAVSRRPLAKRLVSGASWALLSKLLTYPAGLVLTVLLVRLLTPEAMGGYFLATSLVAFAVAVVQLGMGRALVKLIAKALAKSSHQTVRQVVCVGISSVLVFSLFVGLSLVTVFGDALLATLDGGDYLHASLRWISLLIISMALVELFAEILRGFHDLRGTSLLVDQLLQRIILVTVLLIFYFSGVQLALHDVLKYSFLSASFAAICGIFLVRSNLAVLGDGGEKIPLQVIYKLGPPFLVLRVNFWLLNMAGIWILGMFRPLEEVALYGAANMISSLVLAPQTVMNGVCAPVIVELFHKRRMKQLNNIIRAAGFFAVIPAMLLTLLLVLSGEDVLFWIYGNEYRQAASVMTILVIGRCIAVSCGVPATTLSMTDHQNTVMKVMTLLSLLTLLSYFLFAEQAGALGIALVTAISIAMQNLVMVFLVKKHLGMLTFPALSPAIWQGFVQQLLKRKPAA
ncbi:hypothetical protein MNBD_GAMMA06-612 [hydrothermal vent metagenome]|uniref:Polysaccharide biosynthesis protein C-terminal domain-containing protein n=1 Tax=hydrothermal vent metagenome TaxID=652676 RepID=A0A3B0WUI7_9ZZZZ